MVNKLMNKFEENLFNIYSTEYNGIIFCFIRNNAYIDRKYLYGGLNLDYKDYGKRFSFFKSNS